MNLMNLNFIIKIFPVNVLPLNEIKQDNFPNPSECLTSTKYVCATW